MSEIDDENLHKLATAIARAMTEIRGKDPDVRRPATGYSDAPIISAWELDYEWALRFIAGYAIMKELSE